jgi:spore maturation protein A
MLNYLWGGMILLAIVVAVFTGNMAALTNSAIESAREAVTLCITMLGVLSMWTGIVNIGQTTFFC